MRLRHEVAYDAPPADVLAMVTDPLFWDRVGDSTRAITTQEWRGSGPGYAAGFEKEQVVGAAWVAGERG